VGRDLSQHRYDAAVGSVLPGLGAALAGLVVLVLAVDLTGLTSAGGLGVTAEVSLALAVVSAFGLGALGALGFRGRLPVRLAEPLTAAALVVAAGNVALSGWLDEDPLAATLLVLAVAAAGTFVLDLRWATATGAVLVGTWVAVVWANAAAGLLDGASAWHLGLAVVAAAGLGLTVGAIRRTAVDRFDQLLERARRASVEDPLTGLLNRRGLTMVGRQVEAAARRAGNAVHCVLVDVDGLKAVNDRSGHSTGDRVLLAVADAIRLSVRSGDVVARWGGDEFAVLGPGPGTAPLELERRVVARLAELPPDELTGWEPGVSAGSAMLAPWDEGDLGSLLDQADREMHRRRALRRSGVVPGR
jgi:diguanylate cyclase (GGDEF)-like protein